MPQSGRGLVLVDAKIKELPDMRDFAVIEAVSPLLSAATFPVIARAIACRAFTSFAIAPACFAVGGFELETLLDPERLPR